MDERPDQSKLTAAECDQLAEILVDTILDPSTPWLRKSMLAGLQYPQLARELTGALGFPLSGRVTAKATDLSDALEKTDRKKLLDLFQAGLRRDPPTREQAQKLMNLDVPMVFRHALQKTARMFPAKRGRKPKIRKRDYPKIADWAEKLVPVCQKVLEGLESKSRHTIAEILEFEKADHSEACTFLLHHLGRFEKLLEDQKLLNQVATIDARARLIADAMAGADYELSFRTSIQRAREGRRLRGKATS